MKTSPLIAMSVLACLTLLTNAYSTPITVTNYSFEATVLGDGVSNSIVPTGWTLIGTGNRGTQNPVTGSYGFIGATDSVGPTFGNLTPVGGDQRQVVFVNATNASGATSLSQTLTGVTLLPSSTYTLNVAIGNEGSVQDGFKIELFAGATSLGSASGSSGTFATVNRFADATVIYTSPSTGLASGDLRIVITNTHSVISGSGQTIFDNVRLDVVPEPSSVALVCIGGVAFMAWRTRRKMA